MIWTDEYIYSATISGTTIYDLTSGLQYAYIDYASGFNTVWANDDYIFYGTTNSGVLYIDKTCISGSIISPYDLIDCLSDFSDLTYYSELTSNNIRYIHGNADFIACCTNSGVDFVKLDPQSYRSYTTVAGARKCFVTSAGELYYTVSGTNEWSVHRKNSLKTDWNNPDVSYTTGSGILAAGISMNDIFITENTAADGFNNIIFAATSSGVYRIDESDLTYYVYHVGGLKGTNNNFKSVWVYNGKMYAASSDTLNVVDLTTSSVYDYYSGGVKGRANEYLDDSNITDLNVVG